MRERATTRAWLLESLDSLVFGRFDRIMVRLKTLVLLLMIAPSLGRAADDGLLSAFASCTGRFSAELEHAWLTQNEQMDEIERRRSQFVDLLDATLPPDQGRHALNLRIDAKVAHAALLAQATFSKDRQRAQWALQRAESEIAYCRGFLLES